MKSLNIILAVFFGLLFSFKASCQETTSFESINKYEKVAKEVEGTYQIQVINTRDKPFIPYNIGEIVINNRQPDVVVYYKLGDNVRLKILPDTFIKSREFLPLQQIDHIQE